MLVLVISHWNCAWCCVVYPTFPLASSSYVDAINVCHKVLKEFPDYPQIRKEIMMPARKNLRP